MKRISNLRKDTFYSLLVKGPVAVLTFLYTVFLTRLLGPSGNGVYSFITVNAYFFILLLGLNFTGSTTYFLAGKQFSPAKTLGFALVVFLGGTGLLLLGLAAVYAGPERWMSVILPTRYASLFYLGFVFFFFLTEYLRRLFSSVLRGYVRFFAINVYSVVSGVLFVVCYAAGWFYCRSAGRPGCSVEAVFLLILGVQLADILIFAAILFRNMGQDIRFSFSLREMLPAFAVYSWQGYIQQIGNFVSRRVGVWVVETTKGVVSLGHYALATQATNFMQTLAEPFNRVMMPYLVKMDRADGAANFAVVSRVSFWAMSLGAAVAVLAADFIVPVVYGEVFRPAILPLKILCVANVFINSRNMFLAYNRANDRQKINVLSEWVGLVIVVGLSWWWVPVYGIAGAAWATLAAFASMTFIVIWFTAPHVGAPLWQLFFLQKEDFQWAKERMLQQWEKYKAGDKK